MSKKTEKIYFADNFDDHQKSEKNKELSNFKKEVLSMFEESVLPEDVDKKFLSIEQNIATNASRLTAVETSVSGHTTSIGNLQTAVGNIQTEQTTQNTSIGNLQTQVATNTQNIGAVQSSLTTDESTLSTLVNTTIPTMQSKIAENTRYIQFNNENIMINVEDIAGLDDRVEALENGSVTASGVDSGNATSGQVLTADGQGGASWTNASGGGMTQEQATKLDQTYNYFLSHLVEPDPSYNPQTFSDYPAGTILQGYAKFERIYNKSFSGTITTTKMVFSAQNGSSGALHLHIKFSSSVNFNGLITVYNNNSSVFSETISFSNNTQDFEYEKEIMGLSLSSANIFYVTIGANPATTSLVLKYIKSELIAPNAEVMNQISPFNVEYFNGKYYLSDCSSGTAKIAEIEVENMNNMNNLTWTDTGIVCWNYKVCFYLDAYGDTLLPGAKVHYYFMNDNLYFVNESTNANFYAYDFVFADWIQTANSNPKFATYIEQLGKVYSTTLNSGTTWYNSNNRYAKISFIVNGSKYLGNYWNPKISKEYAVMNLSNGNIQTCLMSSISSTSILTVGKGKNAKIYLNVVDSSTVDLDCYYTYFDKIIKKVVRYTSGTPSILSQTEIGAYEEYFEGANNDYFVIKNGKFEYHKKP